MLSITLSVRYLEHTVQELLHKYKLKKILLDMLHKIMHWIHQTSSGTYCKIKAYISKFEILVSNECSTAKIAIYFYASPFFSVHRNAGLKLKGSHQLPLCELECVCMHMRLM